VISKKDRVLTRKSGGKGGLKKREGYRRMASRRKNLTKERVKGSRLRELIQQTVRRIGIETESGQIEETLRRRRITAPHTKGGETVTTNLTTDERKTSKIGERERIPRGALTSAGGEKGAKKRTRMNESEVLVNERKTSKKENIAPGSGESSEPSTVIRKTNSIGSDEDGDSVKSESLRGRPSLDDGTRYSRNQKLIRLGGGEDWNRATIGGHDRQIGVNEAARMGKKGRNLKETSDIGAKTTSAGEIGKAMGSKMKNFRGIFGRIIQNTVRVWLMMKSLSGIAKEHNHLDVRISTKKSINITGRVFADLINYGNTTGALPKSFFKGLGIEAGSGTN